MERLDFEQCLKDILAGNIGTRTLSDRNSHKIAALCTQERMARLNWREQDNLLKWIGTLAKPEVGRELLRTVLAKPESLPQDCLARFIAAPVHKPRLLFDGEKYMDICPLPEDIKDSTNPADAIIKNANAVLRGFQSRIWGAETTSFHMAEDDTERVIRLRYPEIVRLVETDSVEVIRMMADVRLEPMPIAHMFHLGGPKCHKLLLRPETYERSELTIGSLATYAVMAMCAYDTMSLLDEIEAENPGLLRTVKDTAGHNLLWYMGFRKSIFVHKEIKRSPSARWLSSDAMRAVRDFLLKAKCDRKERDVFGVSWNDVQWNLF